jgi:hypothetical protein
MSMLLQGVGSSGAAASSLNFGALGNLPVGRQSAVQAAIETAVPITNTAMGTSITAQDGIGYLAAANMASLAPGDGCAWQDETGTTIAGSGDPLGRIEAWSGTLLATQANAPSKPSVGANGAIVGGASAYMLPPSFSGWSQAFGMAVFTRSTASAFTIWDFGSYAFSVDTPTVAGKYRDDFFGSSRGDTAHGLLNIDSRYVIYQGNFTSEGTRLMKLDGVNIIVEPSQSFSPDLSAPRWFSQSDGGGSTGTAKAIALASSSRTLPEIKFLEEFSKAYWGITY